MSSTVRITQASIGRTVMSNLQAGMARLQQLQEQLSSGRLINRPSDSPAGTISSMQFRSAIARSSQYQRNCDDALGWLGTADDLLNNALVPMSRIQQLVISGNTGAASPESREALAAEIDQLRDSLLAVANTSYLGRPLFGGTTGNAVAYVKDPTTKAITYNGDNGDVVRTIAANSPVAVNLKHDAVFGPDGADIFTLLSDIADHLRNDPSQLSTDLGAVDVAQKRMVSALADAGARERRIESMRDAADSSLISLNNGLTDVENIDLPKTLIDMRLQEVAYQAALGSAARIIQPTLLDFLR